MRQIVFTLTALVALALNAQTPQEVLDGALAKLKSGGNVTASYSVKGSGMNSSGTITMNGSKYFLNSSDVKCWFDGTTLWTYSTATGEVNITTPTGADIQAANPYAAVQDFKRNYHIWKAAGQIAGLYAIMLMPKQKAPIKQMYLYFDKQTNWLRNVHVKMNDGTAYTITLTKYKTNVSVTSNVFSFNKNLVPPGTEVVDLR